MVTVFTLKLCDLAVGLVTVLVGVTSIDTDCTETVGFIPWKTSLLQSTAHKMPMMSQNIDSLTSYIDRVQLHLSSVAPDHTSPLSPSFFGCSDFYPPPPTASGKKASSSTTATPAPTKKRNQVTPSEETVEEKENQPATDFESSSDEDSEDDAVVTMPPATRRSSKKNGKKGSSNESSSNNSSDNSSSNNKKEEEYLARIKELEASLEQKNQEAVAPAAKLIGKLTAKDRQQQINKEVSRMVANFTTKYIWRTTKFIKDEKHLAAKTNEIIDLVNLKEHQLAGLKGQELANANTARSNWNVLYRDDVRMEINNKRNYTQVR